MKSFGPKKFKFHAWVKIAILSNFQKSTDWLDFQCSVGAALQTANRIFCLFYTSIFIYFFEYETIV